MNLSLKHRIYFFTLTSCLFFIVLAIGVLWSIQVVELALERERYAQKVESHSNILKQLIISENIYVSNYNATNWQLLNNQFNELLRAAPKLPSQQKTIQNSIESQNKSVNRLFNAINKNQLENANEKIKKHLKIKLMTQLEAIRADSTQLFSIANKNINSVIKHQVILILSLLSISLFVLIYGALKLVNIFKTSLQEVKTAFEKNSSDHFQDIQLSNQSEEFTGIAKAFNQMNKKLSETTVSLESMKKIVAERTEALETLSNTDPLTKVANRRSLFERGNNEIARVQRSQNQLSLILLDCDLFKNINDKYGHAFGDEVLLHLCKICTKEIRDVDFFARYGGEEFIIVLPDSDINGAVKTAERIQQSLAHNCIAFEEEDVSVTLSIGVCMAHSQHTSFEALIKDADIAMYKAKENGRNRIEVV